MNIRGKLIGSGRKRKVYDLGNGYVLKVAKSKTGLHSNKTEFMLYRSNRTNSLRKHLAKVVRYGRRWLIMKKYDRPFILSSQHYKQYRLLQRRFRRHGIRPRDMYSMTHKAPSLTNLRLNRRGEIVVIDYGNFRIRSRHRRRRDAQVSKFKRGRYRRRIRRLRRLRQIRRMRRMKRIRHIKWIRQIRFIKRIRLIKRIRRMKQLRRSRLIKRIRRVKQLRRIRQIKRIRRFRRKVIGIGTRRIVYDLRDGNVLKVARSRYGIKSNQREVELYQSTSRNIQKYLGKVVRYSSKYKWVVMKKYARRVPKKWSYTSRLYQIRRIFKRSGILPYEVTYRRNNKPNYKNIRLKQNNSIVVVDFGNFKRISPFLS